MAGLGFVPVSPQLITVRPEDIEWNEVPEAEVQQWFERHQNLESWLPQSADCSSVPCFLAFMGWLRIRKESTACKDGEPCLEQIIAFKRRVTADMVWLWMQSEHLKKEELYGLIVHAAELFHDKVGYCLVYHANTFMAEELILERLWNARIQRVSLPRAVDSFLQDADLPPPKVPDSDDDASSFKEADAESDHDVQEYITGPGYEAVP